METIKSGLYLRRDNVPYESIDAANYSTIKHFAASPLHYRHRIENPAKQTNGQLRGTAAHTAILEPHRLFSEYAVYEGERRAGQVWKDFEAANVGKKIIKQNELEQALAMRDAVRGNPAAMAYLAKGHPEATMVWVDPSTDLRCKCRTDWIADGDVIVDVKGCADASAWTFGAECFKQQYHVQAAFYADGYEVLFPQSRPHSIIIAVESKPPHDVVVYNLDDETLGVGRDAYRKYLEQLKECRASKSWPGRANGLEMTLKLPAYAMPDESDLDALDLEM